jgi:hypothetical protein
MTAAPHTRQGLGQPQNTQLALLNAQVDSEHAPPAHAPGSADGGAGAQNEPESLQGSVASERRRNGDEQDALDGTAPPLPAAALPQIARRRTDYPHFSRPPSSPC